MSEGETGLIAMISHFNNGGCTQERGSLGLGKAVGTNVGIG